MSLAAPVPPVAQRRLLGAVLGVATACGAAAAFSPYIAYVFLALGLVGLATRYVERLAVLTFWTLPYMVVNLPTGAFTLKLPEVTAYLFAAAVLARALWRRESIKMPPATAAVLLYLAVLCISTAAAPVVPASFHGAIAPTDRNAPTFRSISIIVWLIISWSVVVAAYHVIGTRPALFRRCLRAHILGGGLAATLSLGIYVLTLAGMTVINIGGLGVTRNLAPFTGDVFRLAGVAYEPLFLAFYLVTVIPITVAAALFDIAQIPRSLAAGCLFIELLAMTLTFSTGGYVALAIALLLLVPVFKSVVWSRRAKLALAASGLALIIVVGGLLVGRSGGFGYFGVVFGKLLTGGDDIRQAENSAGMRILEDYPILGVGPGMAGYHFPRYHPVMQSQLMAGGIPEVNNAYFSALAETGVAGLAALILCGLVGGGVILRSLRLHGWRRGRVLGAFAASLGGCGVQYMGLNPLFLIYFTGLLALAVSAYRLLDSGIEAPVEA